MDHLKLLAAVLAATLFAVLGAGAAVIRVPDDYETIHGAIAGAQSGDTVLVAPGTYTEQISITTPLTLASLILTTGDRSYIDSTIIDGGGSGSVVTASNNGDQPVLITGFTIQHGRSQDYYNGGGVAARSGKIVLRDLLVRDNAAYYYGGGISAGGEPTLERVEVAGNSAYYGGGIYLSNTSPATLREVVIRDNAGQYYGGGIDLYSQDRVSLENVQATHNTASYGGGGIYIYYCYRTTTLSNCTIADNESNGSAALAGYSAYQVILSNTILSNGNKEIGLSGQSDLTVGYCDIRGGKKEVSAGGDLTWGDSNIDADPLFVAADSGDYHLLWGSPCMDSGDPETPLDSDSTRADIGALPFQHHWCQLQGYVYDSQTGDPIPSARLLTSYGRETLTGENGSWAMARGEALIRFNLTVSVAGYLDSTLADYSAEEGDTLNIEFRLLHPIFRPTSNEVAVTLPPDSGTNIDFSADNPGNYPLRWDLERVHLPEVAPWSRVQSYQVGQAARNHQISGVAFAEDVMVTAGGQSFDGNETWIYLFDRNGQLVNQFRQFGQAHFGMKDLTYDGDQIWGSGEQDIFGFSVDGELISRWQGPYPNNYALAWDEPHRVLWIASLAGQEIVGYSRNGNKVRAIPQENIYVYSMDCWPDDPNGYTLYIMTSPNREQVNIIKMNTDTGDTMTVKTLAPPEGGGTGGLAISDGYNPYTWSMLWAANAGDSDRVDVYRLSADPKWLSISPVSGEIAAGATQQYDFRLESPEFLIGEFRALLSFTFPEVRSAVDIPVTMRVELNSILNSGSLVSEFGLEAAYPNPFNQSTVVSYKLPVTSRVSLFLYDIAGREIMSQQLGIGNPGSHRAVIDGSNLSSGVYLLKLIAGKQAAVRKVVCVK